MESSLSLSQYSNNYITVETWEVARSMWILQANIPHQL